jgi:class 3 adenylate cyclase/lipopolysaccharide biosynthesis regulator YciM
MIVLLLVLTNPFASAISKVERIDSLKKVLPYSENERHRVDLLNALGSNYYRANMIDSFLIYNLKAIKLSEAISYPKGKADAYFELGKYELVVTGRGDYATTYLLKSLEIFTQLKDSLNISNCNLQLGVLNFDIDGFHDAIQYLQKTLDHIKGNDYAESTAHFLMALSYSELGEFDKSQEYFGLALEGYEGVNTEMELQVHTFLGKMYINQGDFDKAVNYLLKSISSYKSLVEEENLAPPYAFLSTAYLALENYEKTIEYGLLAYNFALNQNGSQLYIREAEKNLHQAYQYKGNFKEAYFYLNALNDLKDSAYNTNITRKVAETVGKYEFEKEFNREKAAQELRDSLAAKEIQRQKTIRNVLIGGLIVVFLFAFIFFTQKNRIAKSRRESEELLLNILPMETAEELKKYGSAEAKQIDLVTVIFADFVGFTQLSEKLSASSIVKELHDCFSRYDEIMEKYGVEKIKTIGDSYMAAGGLPTVNKTHPSDVVNAAIEIQNFMQVHKSEKELKNEPFLTVRIGIHTGPVVSGIVGVKKFQYDIWGDTVNTASRMESASDGGKINISSTTYELVKDKFNCSYRGEIEVKGKGKMTMYFVENKEVIF